MSKVDLSQAPYHDDYNENKKFYKILFRPGRAVQTRELTQMQTMLQKQIERMGSHIFQNGAQVLPGSKEGVKYINNNLYIKIPRSALADDIDQLNANWLGKTIQSVDTAGGVSATGIKAKVIGVREPDSINEARLYLNLLEGSGAYQHFSPAQTIETVEGIPISATIPNVSTAIGKISSMNIEAGVYFFNGNFVLVDEQILFLIPDDPEVQEDWNNLPTALGGLTITESIVTAQEDPSLYDNATGTTNTAAPGADRLAIEAIASQQSLNFAASDFVPLLRVIAGEVQFRTVKTDLSILEDTLARRTFDESGDYSVRPFDITIKDFLRAGNNNGVHPEEEYHYPTENEAQAASVKIFGQPEPGVASLHPNLSGVWVPGDDFDQFVDFMDNRLSIKVDPGKAYVKGYEIEKISTSVVDLERARTLQFENNRNIFTPLGTYVFVTNMFGDPSIPTNRVVELHSTVSATPGTDPGQRIGTARIHAVEFFSGANGTDSAVYRVYLYDIRVEDRFDINQAKSIYIDSPTFSCNIQTTPVRLRGSINSDPLGGQVRGIGTSWRNDSTQRLFEGDVVQIGLSVNTAQQYVVTETPDNDNLLKLEDFAGNPVSSSPTWPDGSVIDVLRTEISGLDESPSLIFPLPHEVIYSVRGETGGEVNTSLIDTTYTSRRTLSGTADGTGHLSFTISDPNEEFADFSTIDYIVINKDNGDWLEVIPFVSGSPSSGVAEIETSGSGLDIYTNLPVGTEIVVIASVIRSGGTAGQEKGKTLESGSFDGTSYSGPFVVADDSNYQSISLGKADVLHITRVVESPDFNTTPSNLFDLPAGHKDITGAYILDSGQTDYYYGIARAELAPGAVRPKGQVRVEFDYFKHVGTGNYFSVDSYPFRGPGAQMRYEDIPLYRSENGSDYDLASCIDFRPRVDEPNGIDDGFDNVFELPKENFRCDYWFYLGRKDKLYLDRTGQFKIKKGVPSENPVLPPEPSTGMTLYNLHIRPYTANPLDCVPSFVDNRRYTMRDIGKLENRVKNLEYYTTLTLLEKETSELTIKDSLGQDKFKNGFLVDNFTTHEVSDIANEDYRASIDTATQTLRPIVRRKNVRLFEKNLLEPNPELRRANRSNDHYQKTNDVFTLPYTEVAMEEQTKASKISNVNPFAVYTYTGDIDLRPSTDEWKDTTWADPLNIQDSSAYEKILKIYPDGEAIDYGASINNWTGFSLTNEPTGKSKLLVAGHAHVQQVKDATEAALEELKENRPKNTKQGNKGSKGPSTQRGPGQPTQNAKRKPGRGKKGGDKPKRRKNRKRNRK